MERLENGFHFPPDIKLNRNPLTEAWLEIRWKLTSPNEHPDFRIDSRFKFALGAFSQSVEDNYGFVEDLPASHIPEEIAPYMVRHRFRPGQNEWPLLQIGPGIASVNFERYDRWEDFERAALYLREKLVSAYQGKGLTIESVALRYRDAEQFAYSENDFLEFLQSHLNTSVKLPDHIPGAAGSQRGLTHADLVFTYDLAFPRGRGTIRLSTGTRQIDTGVPNASVSEEVVVWLHEIISSGEDAPAINSSEHFENWLRVAHAVIHEWFFSLIDGPLRTKYESE